MSNDKHCPKCQQDRLITDFDMYYSKSRQKYRPQSYCRHCKPADARKRGKDHFRANRDAKLQYARAYRANPANKEKRQILSRKFKIKYREELQDCYVRDLLSTRGGIPPEISREHPEIVEAKRLQIKIKRKIKTIKDAKK